MTKDDIQKLILESNALITTETNGYQVWMPENIEKFADLVAKAEREACARLCDEYIDSASDHESGTASGIQEAIRARGQMINGMTEQETNETMSVKGLSEPEPEPVDDKELMRRVMALMPEVAVKATEE